MRKFGRNDIIFIGILAVVCIGLMLAFYVFPKRETDNGNVIVTVDGEVYGTYSLQEDQTVEILDEDDYVTNVFVIKDGKADMISADCPDKLCVNQSEIELENETIVCLPNRVVLTVESDTEAAIDSVAK